MGDLDALASFKNLKMIMSGALPFSDLQNFIVISKGPHLDVFKPSLDALFHHAVEKNRHADSDATALVFTTAIPYVRPEFLKTLIPDYLNRCIILARQEPARDELDGTITEWRKPEDHFFPKHRKNIGS